MADKTFLGSAALDVAIKAETHVDFIDWHHSVHGLDRSMAFLASNSCPDMRLVHELHKIGQRVDSIPANLEWRLMGIGPGLSSRFNPAEQSTAMASDTSRYRRGTRRRRPSCILVAVLARNFVDTCMHTMAEGDRLFDIRTRRPRSLRKRDRGNSARKQKQREEDQ